MSAFVLSFTTKIEKMAQKEKRKKGRVAEDHFWWILGFIFYNESSFNNFIWDASWIGHHA